MSPVCSGAHKLIAEKHLKNTQAFMIYAAPQQRRGHLKFIVDAKHELVAMVWVCERGGEGGERRREERGGEERRGEERRGERRREER